MRHFRDDRGDPYGGMLAIDLATPGVFGAIFSTSGTTGDPTLAPFAGREGPTILAREFWELGVRPGDAFVEMLFTYRGPAIHWTMRGIGATPIFVDHDPAELPRLFELSRQFQPTGWYNLSGPLIIALQQLAESGVDIEARWRRTAGSSTPASPWDRGRGEWSTRGGSSSSTTRASATSAPPRNVASTTAYTYGRTPRSSKCSIRMVTSLWPTASGASWCRRR